MSHDSEDSVLEAALRDDLPTADTEARLRRRLLAVGLAVGNGVATSAATAGTVATGAGAGAPGAAVGFGTKILGLSWGFKLGVAAAIAIPTVGLLLDARGPREQRAPGPAHVVDRRREEPPAVHEVTAKRVATDNVVTPLAVEPERAAPHGSRLASELAPTRVDANRGEHPSQATFVTGEAAPPPARAQSTLAEETRLLDAAFAALASGDRARAASLLAEHEARYPQGLLRKERERAKARLSEPSRGN